MDSQTTPEKLQQWTETAQELALENWDDSKIVAHLKKRGCEPQLAAVIAKAVIKAARSHNRRAGLRSIVIGAVVLVGFAAFILSMGQTGVHLFAPKLLLVPLAAMGMIGYGIFQLLFG